MQTQRAELGEGKDPVGMLVDHRFDAVELLAPGRLPARSPTRSTPHARSVLPGPMVELRSEMATTITLIGNLTREPEIRYTRDGQATTSLGVAVNRRWQDRTTKEWEESTSFFDVVCWRELAENAALSLVKGMRVVVTGRLEHRSWDTEEGEHRSKVEVVADDLGPSLRFATAEVQRTERKSAAAEDPGDEPGDPGTAAGANRSSASMRRARK
jgi:single-strand DNA-binding protein